MSYKLILTHDERRAIDWIGNRYATGDDFRSKLWKCYWRFPEMDNGIDNVIPGDFDEDWNLSKDIEFKIPENIAWEIRELFEQDELTFPCFSDELKSKLIEFYYNIVRGETI